MTTTPTTVDKINADYARRAESLRSSLTTAIDGINECTDALVERAIADHASPEARTAAEAETRADAARRIESITTIVDQAITQIRQDADEGIAALPPSCQQS
jgi:hypothetical protein